MSRDEIYDALTELFGDVFYVDHCVLTPELTSKDVEGWDSISHINLILAVEQRFGFKIRSREIEGLTNVGDLVRLIEAKIGSRPVQVSQP